MKQSFPFLLMADLQLDERKEFSTMKVGLNSRLLEGLSIINQLNPLIMKYGVKHIFLLGDVFEKKDRIPARIMYLFADEVSRLKCPMTVLKGNHDFAEDDYPPIKLLTREGKLYFVDYPLITSYFGTHIAFLPYFRKLEKFKEEWENLHQAINKTNIKPKLFLFHNTIPGAMLNPKKKLEGELSLTTLPGVKYLGGDIHLAQRLGRIQYLGSPYQINFGEEDQEKFVYLFDGEETLKPVQLKYPKFVSIPIDDKYTEDSPILDLIEGNYIRITGEILKEQKQDLEKLKELISEFGPQFIISTVNYKSQKSARIEAEKNDQQAVITEFLEKTETDLDKTKLKEIGLSLLKEASV